MQFSANGVDGWTINQDDVLGIEKIERLAKNLGVKPGQFIYYRQREGDFIGRSKINYPR